MKRISALVLLLTVILAGCAASEQDGQPSQETAPQGETQPAPYRFAIGYSGTGYDKAFEKWHDLVYEDTDGNVELLLYGENVLGEGKDMIKAVQRGTLSIMASSTSVCTEVVPEAAILDIPFCFSEYCRPYQVYDGVFFDALNQYYNDNSLELLFLRTGEPWLLSTKEPAKTLTELQGMRIRTIGGTYHNKLYNALGIQCVENIGLSSLSYLLDENAVDGIETTLAILRTQGLLEMQPYALRGPLFVMSSAIVMNYDAFHSLPEDYQASIKQRLGEVLGDQQSSILSQSEEGITIYDLSADETECLREKSQPLLDEILSTAGQDLAEALVQENAQHAAEGSSG